MEWFAQRFTHDRHAGGERDTPRSAARYALWRWCWASSHRWFARKVRNH